MKCALCSTEFNDGVQCGSCKKHLDFNCARITEVTWRKLGPTKRGAWKCVSCRLVTPVPAPSSALSPTVNTGSGPVTLEIVLKEIQEIKSQLSGLPTLLDDVRTIKEEIIELKMANEFSSNNIVDLTARATAMEAKIVNFEQLDGKVYALQSELATLKSQLSASEQRGRLNNVEIKGIPTKKDENLFIIVESLSKKLNCPFPKSQIDYLYRVPQHNSKEKSIIVSFLNRYVKEEFVAAARAYKTLNTADIGFNDSQQRIFVNDHLSGESKNLLTKAKIRAKESNYNYVWVKYGKIHLRKNDISPIMIIYKEADLNKIA